MSTQMPKTFWKSNSKFLNAPQNAQKWLKVSRHIQNVNNVDNEQQSSLRVYLYPYWNWAETTQAEMTPPKWLGTKK